MKWRLLAVACVLLALGLLLYPLLGELLNERYIRYLNTHRK